MYVRTTQRRNADGSVVRYVALAAKKRVEGKSVAQVLVNLAARTSWTATGWPGWSPRSTATSGSPTRPRRR
jgi:hypothetical protein